MSNDTSPVNVKIGISPDIDEKDAQMKLMGVLKTNTRTEMVVFSFQLLMVEVTAIVVIPAEGTHQAPVYLKFKIRK